MRGRITVLKDADSGVTVAESWSRSAVELARIASVSARIEAGVRPASSGGASGAIRLMTATMV